MASLDGLHVEANGRDGAVPHVSTDGLVRSCFGSRFQISAGSAEGRTYSIVNSPPCATRSACKIWNVHHTGGGHTASTRSKDVLPAFWSPIMVMSISEFLQAAHQHSSSTPIACIVVVGVHQAQ